MTRRLVTSYLAVALLVLIGLEVPLGFALASREYDRLTAEVVSDAVVLGSLAEESLEFDLPVTLPPAVRSYAASARGRVVVTDADGISVADTGAEIPRDFSTRPEVMTALEGERAVGRRDSETLGEELLYVAEPILHAGGVLGVVRITYSTQVVRSRITRTLALLVLAAVVVLVVTALVAVRLATWAVRPVARIGAAVERFGSGDLDARVGETDGPPEVVALAERIDDMAERIESLVEAQRGFVADASHQLRTPLTGLRLELENLEAQLEDEAAIAAVDRAVASTSRLSRMVEGLLALVRLEGQRQAVEDVDVAAAVADAHERWRGLADEEDVELLLDASPATARSRGDDLGQVLDVLLDNAIAASRVGGRVELRVVETGDRVAVTVRDNGPGMSAEDRERAFDRLWQGEASTGSTGLGLAIAGRLAAASGATITLDDAEGGGLIARIEMRTT